MDTASIGTFISVHKESLALLALAFISSMRETLPYPLNKVAVLNWVYAWVHDSFKTWVNMRTGGAHAPPNPPTQKLDAPIPPSETGPAGKL